MTDAARIARLELVLTTLIARLQQDLGADMTFQLLHRLKSEEPTGAGKP